MESSRSICGIYRIQPWNSTSRLQPITNIQLCLVFFFVSLYGWRGPVSPLLCMYIVYNIYISTLMFFTVNLEYTCQVRLARLCVSTVNFCRFSLGSTLHFLHKEQVSRCTYTQITRGVHTYICLCLPWPNRIGGLFVSRVRCCIRLTKWRDNTSIQPCNSRLALCTWRFRTPFMLTPRTLRSW